MNILPSWPYNSPVLRLLLPVVLLSACASGAPIRSHALWGGGARLSISINAAEPPPEALRIMLDGLPIEPGPNERLLMIEVYAGHHVLDISADEPWNAEPAHLEFQISRQGESRYILESQPLPLLGTKIYRLSVRRID